MSCNFLVSDQQKGRSNKKNKKKKRPKSLSREITLAQAQQQMFGAYFKVIHINFYMNNKKTCNGVFGHIH